MSTDTDRLEKEAESHRSNLDSTFDAIRDRLSVGQIVDEFSGYLKEGQGADTVKNLGRQVRDNPLALGLVGAGLAWLFLGDGARAKGHAASDRLGRWREDRAYDRFEEAFPADDRSGSPRTGAGRAMNDPVLRSGTGTAGTTSSGPGMGERASSAASSVKGAASSAASGTSDAFARAGRSASGAASSIGGSARRGLHDTTDAVSHAGSSAYDSAGRAGRGIYRAGSRAGRNLADMIQDEPLVFGAVALAVGAAVGAMLPATRREDEWMGETRDHLRDEAYAKGEDTLHRAEDVAQKAYASASETAEEKGLKPDPKDGSSETVAHKVGDVVRSAADTTRDEAKKDGLV
ncbi:DUF3618 domain-containing protein [Fulvimarina sp. 2208YS6-2-32]|uniref:DUF3618 domain-containing protein n=1 Tax=Fulvimarina uroteuthidis TaxID=3098149 RepID=A0ABU5I071_9HYPH|nr:DUF3618 domain-containing protein [Fulvimarina sp. 2208YS6-2-32]MDY8108784.1 DUF3618 domain-containing protein [Fulvimarina sp. 2208YS6-2-32]